MIRKINKRKLFSPWLFYMPFKWKNGVIAGADTACGSLAYICSKNQALFALTFTFFKLTIATLKYFETSEYIFYCMFITYDCLFLCLLRQMELVQDCLNGVLVIHKQSLKNIQHTHSESLVFSNIKLTQTITLITPSMRVWDGHCKIRIKV